MDAVAAVIVHEELAAADPGFTLAYLAHSMLFVNNLYQNASDAQRARYLPDACSGAKIGGMCMSEPAVGTDVLGMKTTATRRRRRLRAERRQDVDHQRRAQRHGARRRVPRLRPHRRQGRTRAVTVRRREGARRDSSSARRSRTSSACAPRRRPSWSSTTARCRRRTCVGNEGDAVRHMMRNLEIERLTLAAMSLGIARRCARDHEPLRERAPGVRPADSTSSARSSATSPTSYAAWMAGRCVRLPDGGAASTLDARPATASTRTASSSSARRWQGGRRPRHPGARRLRLRRRVSGRAAVARRQAARDRRRHDRGAPEEHHARSGEGQGAALAQYFQ